MDIGVIFSVRLLKVFIFLFLREFLTKSVNSITYFKIYVTELPINLFKFNHLKQSKIINIGYV
jgi:hypothetical protein